MRRSIRLLVPALAVALLVPAPTRAATWELDPAHSTIGFAIRHMMISTVRGQLRTFTGKATGDPTAPDKGAIEVTIDATSIDTANAKRDEHLKSPDFLDVAKFPTITFKSKKIAAAGQGKVKLTGDLTLHGVTKEVTLDVEGPSTPIKTQQGGLKAGASATTTINRKDFGLQYNQLIEAGPVVGDEIKVTIDVEANKRAS